jgi:hypothetical protein
MKLVGSWDGASTKNVVCYLGLSGRWNSSLGLLAVKIGNILMRAKTTGNMFKAVGQTNCTWVVELGLDDGFVRLEKGFPETFHKEA